VRRIVGQQAFDAERHVVEAGRRVSASAQRKAQIGGDEAPAIAPAVREQRRDACHALAGPNPLHALGPPRMRLFRSRRDDIGDGAERNEIEPNRQPTAWGGASPFPTRAGTGQRARKTLPPRQPSDLLAKPAPARFRIADGIGRGSVAARKVMIGDEHVDAARRGPPQRPHRSTCRCDRHDELRLPLGCPGPRFAAFSP